jgi:hypothetical protein
MSRAQLRQLRVLTPIALSLRSPLLTACARILLLAGVLLQGIGFKSCQWTELMRHDTARWQQADASQITRATNEDQQPGPCRSSGASCWCEPMRGLAPSTQESPVVAIDFQTGVGSNVIDDAVRPLDVFRDHSPGDPPPSQRILPLLV